MQSENLVRNIDESMHIRSGQHCLYFVLSVIVAVLYQPVPKALCPGPWAWVHNHPRIAAATPTVGVTTVPVPAATTANHALIDHQ